MGTRTYILHNIITMGLEIELSGLRGICILIILQTFLALAKYLSDRNI